MTESRLQHDLVMLFGQKWPEYKDLLFMVHNETTSKAQGSHLKSMGLVAGVSDLIFIVPRLGKIACIELKAPNSTHKREHIERQLEWGQKIIDNNGFYLMTSSINDAMNYIDSLINEFGLFAHRLQTIALENIQNQLKNKTIKF